MTFAKHDVKGEMYTDTVMLGDLVIHKQFIGIANLNIKPPEPYQGILGLGPVTLTEGCVSDDKPVSTVMDNLVAQKQISENTLGAYLVLSTERKKQGALTFGGFDHNIITTPMHYVAATNIFSAGMHLGIKQSITYGPSHENIMSSNVGIIEIGTTLIMLPKGR